MTPQEWLMYAAALGFIVGLIPLIAGLVKRNIKYGLIGFVGSIIGGALLGLLLAVPVAAIFTWLIVRSPKPSDTAPTGPVS
jgi:hypothetical protein